MILGASAEEPHAPFRAAAARMCMCQYVVFGGGAWGAAADVCGGAADASAFRLAGATLALSYNRMMP